ncbi:MAG: hypothetical protein ACQEXX_30430 [Bacillota bacterium]
MKKLYPTNVPEFQTSLFVVCKEDYSETTLKDIYSSDKFSQNIKVYINTRFKDIIYLSIFPLSNKEKHFEKKKKEFIESLSNVCSYISIAYDNQTINYMKEISESVYVLEREFRTLIEIIFLREIGVNWYKEYFQNKDKEKNRIKGRDTVLQYLDNPLDSLDFVHLKSFVEERINLSNNTISDKLNIIENMLVSEVTSSDEKQQCFERIHHILEDIRKISFQKKTGLKVSNLYRHITSELANEWKELYEFRNPWAHNHCLMTRNELETYKELAVSVLKKIRTEITLLSLLESESEFKIQSDEVVLVLTNFSKLGTPFCKLRLQINSVNQQHILEINEATYVEVFLILEILSQFSDYTDDKINLNYLKLNPFLIDNLIEFGSKLFNSEKLKCKINADLEELEELMINQNPTYLLKKLEGPKAYMKEDVDTLLKDIFTKA